MSLFKRKTRKDKRGIVPAEKISPVPLWENYDGGGESDPYDRTPTVYEAPAPSYDRSPTTYDTPPYSGGGE